MDQALTEDDAGVEIIIAGPDPGGYSLHTVTNPGVAQNHTPMGYCAIGSGAPHAMYCMIEGSHGRSWGRGEVEQLVRQAKRRSEVAPGVGSCTQMMVIPREMEYEATA